MSTYSVTVIYTDGETLEVQRVRTLTCYNGEYIIQAGTNPRGGQLPETVWNIPVSQVRSIRQDGK